MYNESWHNKIPMAILQEYRQQRPLRGGYFHLAILVVALAAVVGLMLNLAKRIERAAGTPTASEQPSPTRPLQGEEKAEHATVETSPAGAWQPLPPEEERALLGRVVDQQPLYVREHREAYYYLLKKVHYLSDAALAAAADKSIVYTDYATQPGIIRGAVVSVTGQLLSLEKTDLDPETAGIPAVYEGIIRDRRGHNYVCILTEPPEPPLVPGQVFPSDWRIVRLNGIFLQVVIYRSRHTPPRDIAAPLIIGRRVTPLRYERGATTRTAAKPVWKWGVALGVGAALAAILLLTGRWRIRSR